MWTLKVGLWVGPLAQRAKLCGPRQLHPSLWPYQGRQCTPTPSLPTQADRGSQPWLYLEEAGCHGA